MQKFKSLGIAVLTVGGAIALTQSANAQSYERQLAGVRLNTSSQQLLAKFGNPNEVFIGDVATRAAGGMGGPSMGGGMGGPSMGEDGGPSMGGKGGMGGPSMGGMGGGGMSSGGMQGRGMGGPPSGMGGPSMGGMGGGGMSSGGMQGRGMGGPPSGMGGPSMGGMGGGGNMSGEDGAPSGMGGGGSSSFGNTTSTGVSVQEVTWVYNRKFKNDLISYEFLLSPQGTVSQIRVIGYTGGYARTNKGVVLGSSMADVIRRYGHPEKQSIGGQGILILDYSKKYHMSVQLQLQKVPNDPVKKIYRVIAIVVATIES